ncbi:putative transposase of the Rover3 hAT-like family [Lachancea sp. 'fantastica']|nr:putative transposase of the Rover3 hAT-like family [Lachancea sp. 'fantastica']
MITMEQNIVPAIISTMCESPSLQTETTLVETRTTGWMRRSSLRKHFQVSHYDGMKVATCVHCGKVFKERKSTGNLSKHLKNLHPQLLTSSGRKPRETIEKAKSRALVIKKSLLPNFIATESVERPEEFFEVDLLIEKQLPVSITSSTAWKRLIRNKERTVEPRPILERFSSYLRSFDDELIGMMQTADYVTVAPQIHRTETSAPYLTLSAAFIPGSLNNKTVGVFVEDTQDIWQHRETHLLDVISLGFEGLGANSLKSSVMNTFERFKISDKAILLTCNQEWNNQGDNSLYDGSIDVDSDMAKTPSVRCVSELVETLLSIIVSHIRATDDAMTKAFAELDKLGRVLNDSEGLKRSLEEAEIHPIPVFTKPTAMCVWYQAFACLTYWIKYQNWLKLDFSGYEVEMKEINQAFQVLKKSIVCLSYFVSCCSVFHHMKTLVETDEFNRLSNAVVIYCTLKRFYDACHSANFNKLVSSTVDSSDFSFINGNNDLPKAIKLKVLNAVHQSVSEFVGYLDLFKKNDIYFAAAMLDPSVGHGKVRKYMTEADADECVERGMKIIRCHLKERGRAEVGFQSPVICDKISCFSDDHFESALQPDSFLSQLEVGSMEWNLYTRETITYEPEIDVLQWWLSKRDKFPCLFPLAVSLLSIKLGHLPEQNLQGVDQLSSCDGYCDEYRRLQILLQNRFFKFGLHQPPDEDSLSGSIQSLDSWSAGEDIADEI